MMIDAIAQINKGELVKKETLDFYNQPQSHFLDSLELEFKSSEVSQSVVNVIGSPVTASRFDDQIETMLEWASSYKSKVVCVANVHMLTEAYWHSELSEVLKSADLVTPDGMPLVWMMKLMGARSKPRCGDGYSFVFVSVSSTAKP